MCYKSLQLSIVTLFLLLVMNACSSEQKTDAPLDPKAKSKELNDLAMNFQSKAKDSNDLMNALYYVDQAIQADSSNKMAYSNKVNLLLQLKKVDKALTTLQEANKYDPIPEFIMFEGFILDRNKDTAQAQVLYSKALDAYQQQFATTKDTMLLLNKGFAILLKYGRDSGVHYYQQLQQQVGTQPLLEGMLEQATHFDKTEFLNNLW